MSVIEAGFIEKCDENISIMRIHYADGTDGKYFLYDQISDENTEQVDSIDEARKQYELTKSEFEYDN